MNDSNGIYDAIESTERTIAGKDVARPTGGGLHPRVYGMLIGLAGWFVLSVWLFAGAGLADYLLFVVSGFIFIAVALPLILSAVSNNDKLPNGEPAAGGPKPQSFHDWAAASFATWGGRLSGKQAMVQILLPFAAVAFGMTIIGIVLHVTTGGA